MEGSFLYHLFLFLHILLTMVAMGLNTSYAIWLNRGARAPDTLAFALKGIKFLDDYAANPCYLAAAVTGGAMLALGRALEPYLIVAIVIYVITMLIAYLVYTPLLSRQIKTLEASGASAPEYRALEARSSQIGRLMAILVITIIGLKIFEPALW
jgi:hypothetical protein